MDDPEHSIIDLYYSGSLGKKSLGIENLVDHLIKINKLSLFDVPEEFIGDGALGSRQRIKWNILSEMKSISLMKCLIR